MWWSPRREVYSRFPLAYEFGKPFVPIRKRASSLATSSVREYDLEYGKAEIEMHTDSIKSRVKKVIIVDDLIARAERPPPP